LNLLIAENNTIKITDFGLSKMVNRLSSYNSTIAGTPIYSSPELIMGNPYDFKVDI